MATDEQKKAVRATISEMEHTEWTRAVSYFLPQLLGDQPLLWDILSDRTKMLSDSMNGLDRTHAVLHSLGLRLTLAETK